MTETDGEENLLFAGLPKASFEYLDSVVKVSMEYRIGDEDMVIKVTIPFPDDDSVRAEQSGLLYLLAVCSHVFNRHGENAVFRNHENNSIEPVSKAIERILESVPGGKVSFVHKMRKA